MSLPPTARPPGRPLYAKPKLEVTEARSVQNTLCAGVLEKQKKPPKKPASVAHFGPFHDGSGVHRSKGGQFATETALAHKRPKRLPPFSGPWSEERKEKARITRASRKRKE